MGGPDMAPQPPSNARHAPAKPGRSSVTRYTLVPQGGVMDRRLSELADQLAAGVIARREFLRRAAVVTGGTAAGLHVLRRMASAQSGPKLRVWLFKSYVTAGNEILARHVETWAKERKVQLEIDWATFGAGLHIRKDLLAEKGLKLPKVYDPDVIDVAKKCQDPSKDLWGFGQTLNRCDDGNGFMQNILWDYGGSAWDKDGKPALATTFLKENTAALQFAVDTIQKHKIQPPGVMAWTDPSNNEAYMAGKLVSTNNGASLYYAMVSKKHALADKTQVVLTPGGPAGSFIFSGTYNWGIFKASKHADLCEDLVRWVEDEKRFEEYMKSSIGQAGAVYKARAEHPYWKTDPNFEGMLQNILRSVWPGYPGPITPAAIEVQAQYILCDMAGRVVVGGLSPEAALKEAHKRIEDVYRIRSRA